MRGEGERSFSLEREWAERRRSSSFRTYIPSCSGRTLIDDPERDESEYGRSCWKLLRSCGTEEVVVLDQRDIFGIPLKNEELADFWRLLSSPDRIVVGVN